MFKSSSSIAVEGSIEDWRVIYRALIGDLRGEDDRATLVDFMLFLEELFENA